MAPSEQRGFVTIARGSFQPRRNLHQEIWEPMISTPWDSLQRRCSARVDAARVRRRAHSPPAPPPDRVAPARSGRPAAGKDPAAACGARRPRDRHELRVRAAERAGGNPARTTKRSPPATARPLDGAAARPFSRRLGSTGRRLRAGQAGRTDGDERAPWSPLADAARSVRTSSIAEIGRSTTTSATSTPMTAWSSSAPVLNAAGSRTWNPMTISTTR